MRALALDHAVEAALDADGAVHRYELAVATGEFVQIVIDRASCRFQARLLAADGTLVADADNADGDDEPRALSMIAPAAGEYRVEVALPTGATERGPYRIELAARHAAAA